MTARQIAVIVVGTNEREWLNACLSSLEASSLPVSVFYVDNGSSDNSAEFVERLYPAVHVIRNQTDLGWGAANNIGIEFAMERGACYILLVNPDTKSPPELIENLTQFMEDHPVYGCVGPLQSVYGDPLTLNDWSKHALENGERHAFHHWIDLPAEAGPTEGRAANTLEHAYVQGAALMLRASTLRQVGFFDPVYHTYYDEVDLCRRIRWCGLRVALLLDMRIEHKGGGGQNGVPSYYRDFYMRRNKYYYLFTDPLIPMRTCLSLAIRWLKHELMVERSIANARRDITRQIVFVLCWHVKNLFHIARKRREHQTVCSANRSQLASTATIT